MIISEYGPDLSRFPSEEQFVSHAPGATCTEERRQAGQKRKGGTAPAHVSQPLCVWRRNRCDTATPLSGRTIGARREEKGRALQHLPEPEK